MADGCSLGLVELLHPGEHMFDRSGSGFSPSRAIEDPDGPALFEAALWGRPIHF
jgi:hypothetical protein